MTAIAELIYGTASITGNHAALVFILKTFDWVCTSQLVSQEVG